MRDASSSCVSFRRFLYALKAALSVSAEEEPAVLPLPGAYICRLRCAVEWIGHVLFFA